MAGAARVALLGAGGTIAPAIVRDLAESDEVALLDLYDIDLARARQVAERHGIGKAVAYEADAQAGLAQLLDDADILVNAASYRVNLEAMQACLGAGCHYIDLGGLYHMTAKQLELDTQFRQAGLLGLLGMGASPGKTNVMALHGARALKGAVDEVHISAAGRDLTPPEGLVVPYALRTIVDELTLAPIVYSRGAETELEPLTPGGAVAFGEPVGSRQTIFTLHSEVLTLPVSLGCEECSFRVSFGDDLIETVRPLLSADAATVEEVARSAAPASGQTVATHLVDLYTASRSQHVRVTAVTEPMRAWGLGGGVVSTAAPAAAAVRLLLKGRIAERGVVPAEVAVEPEDLFAELESRGTRIAVTSDQRNMGPGEWVKVVKGARG